MVLCSGRRVRWEAIIVLIQTGPNEHEQPFIPDMVCRRAAARRLQAIRLRQGHLPFTVLRDLTAFWGRPEGCAGRECPAQQGWSQPGAVPAAQVWCQLLNASVLEPLLDFRSERPMIDLSTVMLTHHALKNKGKQALNLGVGVNPTLQPITETGSGSVQEKEKALLAEIIAKVNDLFEGELTEDDKLVYVNNVIKGKLLESEVLVQQAANNTKEQFANSPDLANGILYAIMDALAAHSTMGKQALESEKVRSGLKDVLLGPAQLYEALRAKSAEPGVSSTV